MNTILIFADSHGRNIEMYDIVERVNPDMVLHAGDYSDDAKQLSYAYPNLDVRYVAGNNDYNYDDPKQIKVELPHNAIYMTHGHYQGVHGRHPGTVGRVAKENGCDIAIYGHTHCSVLENRDGVWILNPGSISLPRDKTKSYAKVTMQGEYIREIAVLSPDGSPIKQVFL